MPDMLAQMAVPRAFKPMHATLHAMFNEYMLPLVSKATRNKVLDIPNFPSVMSSKHTMHGDRYGSEDC